MRLQSAVAALGSATLVAILVGCGATAAGSHALTTDFAPAPGDSTAALEVENNGTLDLSVYVVRGGIPQRIGSVRGLSTGTFELPPPLVDREIRLIARPIGGFRRAVSELIRVRPGELLSWGLDDKLRSIRLAIW